MEEKTFINYVKNQFTNADEIELKFDSNFREIDTYDSLTGMTILVMIKDEYDVDISEKEYMTKKTIKDLYDYVNSKIRR